MNCITIGNIDDDLDMLLRISAIKNGHSVEEEILSILKTALVTRSPRYGLGTWIHQQFAELGGVELDITRDKTPGRVFNFDTGEYDK